MNSYTGKNPTIVSEFNKALVGVKGDFDAWLECNDESECRAAIVGAISEEIESCAKLCEVVRDYLQSTGETPTLKTIDYLIDQIRERGAR